MDPTGLLNLGGDALGGIASYYGARQANETNLDIANRTNAMNLKMSREAMMFNADQAALNRNFQEHMSDTSWQRGIADMKAAGINPMLAFSQGGASSPAGSQATGSVIPAHTGAPMTNTMAGLANALSSAGAIGRFIADLENVHADTKLKQANTAAAASSATNLAAQAAYTTARTPKEAVKSTLWSALGTTLNSAKEAVTHSQSFQNAKDDLFSSHSILKKADTYLSRFL